MVDEMSWWAVPIVTLVTFTLYGIEGIGSQLEDPFGYDRNDIKMDAIVGDCKTEIDVVLSEWRKLSKKVDITTASAMAHGERCMTAKDDFAVTTTTATPPATRNGEQTFVQPDLFLKWRSRMS